MAGKSIAIRIALEGADAIVKKLNELGDSASKAVSEISSGFAKNDVFGKLTEQADRVVKSLDETGKAAGVAGEKLQEIGKGVDTSSLSTGAEQLKKSLEGIKEAATGIGENLNQPQGTGFTTVAADADKATQSVGRTGEAAKKTKDELAGVGQGTSNVGQVDREFQSLGKTMDTVGLTTGRLKSIFDNFFQSLGLAGRAISHVSFALLSAGQTMAGFTIASTALGAALGGAAARNAAKAAAEIEKGATAANLTNQEFQRLTNTAKSLGGVNADGLVSGVKALGQAAKEYVADLGKASGAVNDFKGSFKDLAEQAKFAENNLKAVGPKAVGSGWSDAGKSMQSAAEAAKLLGISLRTIGPNREIVPKSGVQLAEEAIRVLTRLPDSINKGRAAVLLLGEDWARMLKTLKPEDFEKAWAQANKASRNLSGDQLNTLAKYNVALTTMQSAMANAAQKLGVLFAPAFTALFNGLARAADGVAKFFDNISKNASGTAGGVFGNLGDTIKKVFQGDFAGALKSAGQAVSDFFALFSKSPGTGLVTALAAVLVPLLLIKATIASVAFVGVAAFSAISTVVTGLAASVRGAVLAFGLLSRVYPVVGMLTGALTQMGAALAATGNLGFFLRMATLAAGAASAVLLVINNLERIKSFLAGIGDAFSKAFSGDFSGAAEKLKQEFSKAWADIKAGGVGLWSQIAIAAVAIVPIIRAAFGGLGSTLFSGVTAAAGVLGRVLLTAFTGIPGLVVIAIAAAATLVYKYWDEIKAGAKKAYDFVTNLFSKNPAAAKDSSNQTQTQAQAPAPKADTAGAKAAGEQTAQAYKDAFNSKIGDLGKQIGDNISKGSQQAADAAKPAADAVGQIGTSAQSSGSTASSVFGKITSVLGELLGVSSASAATLDKFSSAAQAAGAGTNSIAEATGKLTASANSAKTGLAGVVDVTRALGGAALPASKALGDTATAAGQLAPGFNSASAATGTVVKGFNEISGIAGQIAPGFAAVSTKTGELAKGFEVIAGKAGETQKALMTAFSVPTDGAVTITRDTGEVIKIFDQVVVKSAATQQALTTALAVPIDAGGLTQQVTAVSTGLQTLGTSASTVGPQVSTAFAQIGNGAAQAAQSLSTIGTTITTALQTVNASLATAIDWTLLTQGLTNLDLITPFTTKVQEMATALTAFDWSSLTTGMAAAFEAAGPAIISIIQNIQNAITTAFQQATQVVQSSAQSMVDALRQVAQAAREAAEAIKASQAAESSGGGGGGRSEFARGGYVSGPGTGTSDSIPARLSNGEYVLRAKAVRRYGTRLLAALNSGRFKIPKFSTGGLVDGLSSGLASVSKGMSMGSLMLPEVSSSASSSTTVNLTIGNETFTGLQTSDETARQMQKAAVRSNLRSAGPRPSWYR